MARPVKTRTYRSPVRDERAAATRRRILAAATDLFSREGFQATTVAAVASAARVSVDTVYASVGRKPELMLAVIDMTLSGSRDTVTAEERDYVQAIRAAVGARDKIAVYAAALAGLLPALRPLQEALRQAGESDPECASMWRHLVERRAANMRLFAADLQATGQLRADLTTDQVADIVWATNSVEFFGLFEQRGWSPRRFEALLVDLWTRLLVT